MHVSYWESFLKAELQRSKLQKRANIARTARTAAWRKIADNIRKDENSFMPTYYFYDGRRIFIVNVDTDRGGFVDDIAIIESPDFVVTDTDGKS